MTQNNLFLNRLIIITEEGKTAYDEVFHQGVNIIHGQNSSGKSTIIRFIFFVLGGSYGDFVPEVLRCQYVEAEVTINGIVYTLKRYLEKTDDGTKVKKTSPMYIYYGSFEDCKKDQRHGKW
nr:AAA family ATPase [Bacteroidaceae bacterium]